MTIFNKINPNRTKIILIFIIIVVLIALSKLTIVFYNISIKPGQLIKNEIPKFQISDVVKHKISDDIGIVLSKVQIMYPNNNSFYKVRWNKSSHVISKVYTLEIVKVDTDE